MKNPNDYGMENCPENLNSKPDDYGICNNSDSCSEKHR